MLEVAQVRPWLLARTPEWVRADLTSTQSEQTERIDVCSGYISMRVHANLTSRPTVDIFGILFQLWVHVKASG